MFSQILCNAICEAAPVAALGAGAWLVFRCTRLVYIGYTAHLVLAAYLLYWLDMRLGWPRSVCAVTAVLAIGVAGCLPEILIFRRLRVKYLDSLPSLVASLGLLVIVQNVVAIIFGNDFRTLPGSLPQQGILFLGAHITQLQAVEVATTVALLMVLHLLLLKTRLGVNLRAVSASPFLAACLGLSPNRVSAIAFILASSLAGVAGVFQALRTGVEPMVGMDNVLMGIIAAFLGGNRSVLAVCGAALFLSLARSYSVYVVPSQWRDIVPFVLFAIYLFTSRKGTMGVWRRDTRPRSKKGTWTTSPTF